MTSLENAYNNWLQQEQKVETLEQAIYIVLKETQRKPDSCDLKLSWNDILNIEYLKSSIGEFVQQRFGTSYEDVICDEIDSYFLNDYKTFLLQKESNEGGEGLASDQLGALHKIFSISSIFEISNLDVIMFEQTLYED